MLLLPARQTLEQPVSVKINEKQSVVNMVIAEVADIQQVTTQSKGEIVEWEA